MGDTTNGDIQRELGEVSVKLDTIISNQGKAEKREVTRDKRISSLESSRAKMKGATTILGVLFSGAIAFGYWMLRSVGGSA